MKLLIKVLFIILLFSISLSAQYHWQNPTPIGKLITDMQFTDSLHGYVCGYGGLFLRTTDGGSNWTEVETPDNSIILDLFFLNNKTGWILYYNNSELYKTINGGADWSFISDFSNNSASFIYFLDDQRGFAGGYTGPFGYLLKTADGGISWQNETTVSNCYAMYFTDDNHGYAGSTNFLYQTANAGISWTPIDLQTYEFTVTDIYALNLSNIYVIGSGYDFWGDNINLFLNTSNGGSSWDGSSFENQVTDVYFNSPTNGFICTDKILVTTNRGVDWDTTDIPAQEFQFRGNKSWSFYRNALSFSDDGWNSSIPQIRSIFTGFIWDGAARDTNTAFACGSNKTILGTFDGGRNWTKYYTSSTNDYLNGITIKDNEIWAVGQQGLIVYSKDNGTSWTEKNINGNWLSDITFLSNGTGYIAGSYGSIGAIFSSHDGGETWNLTESFPEFWSIDKIKFARDDLGWAIGSPGVILRSTTYGETWGKVIDSVYAPASIAVCGDTAWISYNNRILRTTDAGDSWASFQVFEYNGIIFSQTDIDFVNSETGYECTYDSRVFKSTDGGATWNEENFPRGINNFALDFVNENKGWIFGWPGTIVNRDPFYVSVENYTYNIPEEYILYQNYPNPFNPVTTISYQIPQAGRVTLKVYDILGREAAMLINERKTKGKYSVKFEAASLTSGVYIYQIRVNNYVCARKMLLLK